MGELNITRFILLGEIILGPITQVCGSQIISFGNVIKIITSRLSNSYSFSLLLGNRELLEKEYSILALDWFVGEWHICSLVEVTIDIKLFFFIISSIALKRI